MIKFLKINVNKVFYLYNSVNLDIIKVNKAIYDTHNEIQTLSLAKYINKYSDKYTEFLCKKSYKDFNCYLLTVKEFYSNYIIKEKKVLLSKLSTSSINPNLIIFIITENCNFNCDYCFFGDSFNYTREIQNSSMNIDVFEKIYHHIQNNYNKNDEISFAFYGGEPLLNFKLITQIVTKSKTLKPKIKFNMTTNGFLLNNEIIDFLVKEDFQIGISVDGFKEIHDKHRRTNMNQPTYDTIMEKIELIKQRHNSFYSNNINFIATAFNLEDYNKIDESEQNQDKISLLTLATLPPDLKRIHYLKEQKYKLNIHKNKQQNQKIINKLKRIIEKKTVSRDAETVKDLIRIHIRKKINHFGNSCLPGLDKVCVSAKGELYICEKLDYTLSIGNAKNWINLEKCKKIIIDLYNFKLNNCINCWAHQICGHCLIHVSDINGINIDIINCFKARNRAYSLLKIYCFLLSDIGKEKVNELFEYYLENYGLFDEKLEVK